MEGFLYPGWQADSQEQQHDSSWQSSWISIHRLHGMSQKQEVFDNDIARLQDLRQELRFPDCEDDLNELEFILLTSSRGGEEDMESTGIFESKVQAVRDKNHAWLMTHTEAYNSTHSSSRSVVESLHPEDGFNFSMRYTTSNAILTDPPGFFPSSNHNNHEDPPTSSNHNHEDPPPSSDGHHEDPPGFHFEHKCKQTFRKLLSKLRPSRKTSENRPSGLDPDTCVVCFDAPRKIALVPCGHFCLCRDCSNKILNSSTRPMKKKCPICQRKTKSSLRVYFP